MGILLRQKFTTTCVSAICMKNMPPCQVPSSSKVQPGTSPESTALISPPRSFDPFLLVLPRFNGLPGFGAVDEDDAVGPPTIFKGYLLLGKNYLNNMQIKLFRSETQTSISPQEDGKPTKKRSSSGLQ